MRNILIREYFCFLPEGIETLILSKLDFESLLKARLVSSHWNGIISRDFLSQRANLNIQMDNSKTCRKFKKGRWKENILGCWEEITVHYPNELSDHVFQSGRNSSFNPFQNVTKLTLYEGGKGSFMDFIPSMMASLPMVRYVHIREWIWRGPNSVYGSVARQIWKIPIFSKSWRKGIKNLSQISTFRICLFDRIATLLFLEAIILAQPPLVTVEFDFSKIYGLPFPTPMIIEMYRNVCEIVRGCKNTLEHLKIKWDHRVETDTDLVNYAKDLEPFTEFILMVASNREDFFGLKLKLLVLNFPIVNFFAASEYVTTTFIPFLKSQENSLERFCLSRIRWDPSLQVFKSKFAGPFQNKFDIGLFMVDVDTWINSRFKLYKNVRMLDFHSVASTVFDLGSMNVRRVLSTRSHTVVWKKYNIGSLKFRNSEANADFQEINLMQIIQCFRCLQELELIDPDGENETRQYSNIDLNNIFLMLPKLRSLKITNLLRISDAGLCQLSDADTLKMKEVGVCFPLPNLETIPITQAKCLKFIEFRNLSSKVTDISIYLALQFMPKLEKIAFHGDHRITEWGRTVLLRRFRRNPLFAISFKCSGQVIEPYMSDFP